MGLRRGPRPVPLSFYAVQVPSGSPSWLRQGGTNQAANATTNPPQEPYIMPRPGVVRRMVGRHLAATTEQLEYQVAINGVLAGPTLVIPAGSLVALSVDLEVPFGALERVDVQVVTSPAAVQSPRVSLTGEVRFR